MFSCNISGENLDKAMYCYESDGKMIPDLYAKTVTCCSEFNKIQDNARYLSRIVLDEFEWEGDMPLQIPYEDSIFYKIHVRGYTKSRTSMVKHKGTFDGIIQKADYLKELGITAVELMPAYEYDEAGRFPDYDENEKPSGMYKWQSRDVRLITGDIAMHSILHRKLLLLRVHHTKMITHMSLKIW